MNDIDFSEFKKNDRGLFKEAVERKVEKKTEAITTYLTKKEKEKMLKIANGKFGGLSLAKLLRDVLKQVGLI